MQFSSNNDWCFIFDPVDLHDALLDHVPGDDLGDHVRDGHRVIVHKHLGALLVLLGLYDNVPLLPLHHHRLDPLVQLNLILVEVTQKIELTLFLELRSFSRGSEVAR